MGGAAPIRSRHWRDIGTVHLWVVAVAFIAQMPVFAVLPLAPALIEISSEMADSGVGAWYWGSMYPGHVNMLGKNANIGLLGLWEHVASPWSSCPQYEHLGMARALPVKVSL